MNDSLSHAYVIGMGEVGTRLAAALSDSGVEVRPVTRTYGWDAARRDAEGLRLLCVREEAFAEVLDRLAEVPSHLLVAIQNGWIRPLLEGTPEVGRGLIWFTSKGDFFRVLRPSPFIGRCAPNLADALSRGGIPAEVAEGPEFDRLDADKMGFNCVVGLPLAVHGVRLGDYLERHADEAERVFDEAVDVCARAAGVTPPTGAWEAFLQSVEPLHWVAASRAKALEFRNGAVVRLARELGLEATANASLLESYGV